MKTADEIINNVISRGVGSPKYFKYWVPGIKNKLKTKKRIADAIILKLPLYRCDKNGITFELNYETGIFESPDP